METLLALLPEVMPYIITGVLALAGLFFGWVKRKGWVKAEFLDDLERDVGAVVNETYQDYVKARKEANSDGKLTEEEKKMARKLALDKLIALGKSKGVDYGKAYLIPIVMDLVERWVNRKKDGNDK